MNPNFPENLDIKPTRNDQELRFGLEAQQDAIRIYGIAGRVWEAAYAMTTYLNPTSSWSFDPPPFFKDKPRPFAILELGSGIGVVAAHVARILDRDDLFIATDLPEVCPLLEQTLSSDSSQIVVRPLAWGNAHHAHELLNTVLSDRPQLTHIICSDLVYFPELLAPLLRSLLHLTSKRFLQPSSTESESDRSGPIDNNTFQPPTVIVSYMVRSLTKETPFWSAFGLWFGFIPVLVKTDAREGEWEPFASSLDDPCFIFHAERRPQSQHWDIPESDKDLLEGVGANGTSTRKGDPTFESLLMLAMSVE
ncbi:hypothetical protein FA15DRAFT_635042 [Coprinopsis marcescibilis]|uniref:Methyltransferase-domain-containing protein n=1 Tax=Coprinopsis marcescibilis TaxID=230819 RepID=A0A5C3LGX2_COPMA|nr:hypothetical protein FA15DRAFT_635042 [Coprinopsis marcescibilis]